MNEIKHGGCSVCKERSQEILKSVMVKGEVMGKALCDKCIAKLGIKVPEQE